MATPTVRLRITARSIVVTVAVLALGLIGRNLIVRSSRVLGWLAVAVLVAALVHPIVERVQRLGARRGIAVLGVLVGLGATVGVVAYGTVDDLSVEVRRLQRAAPEAAGRIEEHERFGELARDFELQRRVQQAVDALPQALSGGEPAAALRSAAGRTAAALATVVLCVFVLLHGPRIVRRAVSQLGDPALRARVRDVGHDAYERWWRYVLGSLVLSLAAGVVTWAVASALDLPGPAVLGLLCGLGALLPYVGITIGAIPLLLLAAGTLAGGTTVILAAGVVAAQLAEVAARRRWIEHRSLQVGPAVPAIVAMVALDIAGIGAVFVSLGAAVFLLAVLDRTAPPLGPLTGPTDPGPPPEPAPAGSGE
jgi:predicted PurR-regulated permease PerM